MATYQALEMEIVRLAEKDGVIATGKQLPISFRTLDTSRELLEATASGNKQAMSDAYGRILVTLIVGCAMADLNLTNCLEDAFNKAKETSNA